MTVSTTVGLSPSLCRPTAVQVGRCWHRLGNWPRVTQDQVSEVVHLPVQLQSPMFPIKAEGEQTYLYIKKKKQNQAASPEPTWVFIQFWGTQSSSFKRDVSLPIIAISRHHFSQEGFSPPSHGLGSVKSMLGCSVLRHKHMFSPNVCPNPWPR